MTDQPDGHVNPTMLSTMIPPDPNVLPSEPRLLDARTSSPDVTSLDPDSLVSPLIYTASAVSLADFRISD